MCRSIAEQDFIMLTSHCEIISVIRMFLLVYLY